MAVVFDLILNSLLSTPAFNGQEIIILWFLSMSVQYTSYAANKDWQLSDNHATLNNQIDKVVSLIHLILRFPLLGTSLVVLSFFPFFCCKTAVCHKSNDLKKKG